MLFALCRWRRLWGALLGIVLAGVVLAGLTVPLAHAQPDSVRTERLRAQGYPENHTPRRALWRAAALPGWGQVYNRQYIKLPFVYAGLGGIVYNAVRNQNRYRLYRRANQFAVGRSEADENGGSNRFAQYESQYNEVLNEIGAGASASLIRQQRDAYQRQRNLMVIGTGVFYALTIVDAYVSAHLLTFDVGEDLSIQVHPTWQPAPTGTQAGVQATWRIGR
ncbi:MAG: DUF5683 domain-containing protein [Longimonas sp.]|uniref:DUF5683 domain-containing protein n=1 Tax=Longimonas sp. TaxID=2039626 RepID=UPI0039750E04